ncbi:hypothetical protein MITS9509_03098 [Synechococcus sp. MIT S9509]|nr:hypothetical protein MITS9504_03177 [Synechococcus sp. MIT S9504]KZR89029.1 hypothetical protein MITS9509_03098 [Synechococcus sp. MIT S9509]
MPAGYSSDEVQVFVGLFVSILLDCLTAAQHISFVWVPCVCCLRINKIGYQLSIGLEYKCCSRFSAGQIPMRYGY